MKNAACTWLALGVATFYFTAIGLGQTIEAPQEMPFRLVRNTLIVVPMMANHQGPFDFLIDTGTDMTIVDSRLANRLSLVPVSRIQEATLAGVGTVSICSLAQLTVGEASVESLPVLTRDLGELRRIDPQIQGIVGQNFLRHFNYLLEYRRRTIHFEEGSEIRDSIEGE